MKQLKPPTKYNSVSATTGNLLFGWRCAPHGIATRKYSTEGLRDERYDDHLAADHPALPKRS